jgi:hypothetical protein
MKGYKGFDKDLKCRGFQYEVGKTYECKGKIVLCENGFHFCEEPKQIYGYYDDLTVCRYCEVEASGEIVKGEGKCACSKISIVREISLQEFLSLVNEGSRNTGWMNNGNWNKGDSNVGNGNKGNSNKGDSNEGNSNKGDLNEGDGNEGNCNKGDWNKGDGNEGNDNEGDYNEGDRNEGDWNKGNGTRATTTRATGTGATNIGSYNRADGPCGCSTPMADASFSTNTQKPSTPRLKDGRILFPLAVHPKTAKARPKSELAEIRKLPNFDEKVMNELIFGKGDKK